MRSILFLTALCIACSVAQQFTTNNGFDTINIGYPAWCTELHIAPDNTTMYLFGQSTVRIVTTGQSTFGIQDLPYTWNMPFVDVVAFYNGSGSMFAVGPVLPNQYAQSPSGVGTSIGFGGPPQYGNNNPVRKQQNILFEGMSFSSVEINPDSFPVLTAYLAGWVPSQNITTDPNTYFGLVKATTDLNVSLNNFNTKFWNVATPPSVLRIYPNSYTPFNEKFHPWIFDVDGTNIYVVDPNIDWSQGNNNFRIYHIIDSVDGLSLYEIYDFPENVTGIVSAILVGTTIFVGTSSVGMNGQGAIYTLPTAANNPSITEFLALPSGYNNPKALAAGTSRLFVANNGGNGGVLSFDLATGQYYGTAVLPPYLQNVWEGRVGENHVYFVTYEQNSKVFRVAKDDFCIDPCDPSAYCQAGVCLCPSGLVFDADGFTCVDQAKVILQTVVKKEKGGEIALGILFMISTIAAAVGWYLVWKGKQSSYQRVL